MLYFTSLLGNRSSTFTFLLSPIKESFLKKITGSCSSPCSHQLNLRVFPKLRVWGGIVTYPPHASPPAEGLNNLLFIFSVIYTVTSGLKKYICFVFYLSDIVSFLGRIQWQELFEIITLEHLRNYEIIYDIFWGTNAVTLNLWNIKSTKALVQCLPEKMIITHLGQFQMPLGCMFIKPPSCILKSGFFRGILNIYLVV